MGLVVKEVKNFKESGKAIKIIENMCKRNGIFEGDSNYYHKLFRIFSEKNRIKTFYIEWNGNLIATNSVYLFGKKAARALSAHTDYSIQKKIPGMAFIEWHTIKWAKEKGYEFYDLTGVRPNSQDKKEQGIREYKLHWGEEVHYPYFSKEYSLWKKLFIKLLLKTVKKRYKKNNHSKYNFILIGLYRLDSFQLGLVKTLEKIG